MTNIIEVPIKQIVPDPEVPLFRGPIHNTVSLQESIRQDGIQQPLWVRIPTYDETIYYLFDGNRRFHAARQLGLETVPCIVKEVDGAGANRLAMISSQYEKWPNIVLNEDDEVIGGNCLAVRMAIDAGQHEEGLRITRLMVAEWLGLTSDVVGALYRLYDESPELKRCVAKGHIEITVYSLFKTAPQEVKDHIVTCKMPLSAGRVRHILKNWSSIKKDKKDKKDKIENYQNYQNYQTDNEIKETHVPEEPVTVAKCLNNALHWLRRVNGYELSPSDLWLVKEIDKELEKFGGNE